MIPRKSFLLFIATLVMVVAQTLAAQTETRPFVHNGYRRPYIIHRPANLAARPAVVFMLGGIRSTAKSASEDFNWISESDRNGFLVVFPEPVPTQTDQPMGHNSITFWEMKGSRTHLLAPGALPVDDEGYLTAVLHDVLQRVRRHEVQGILPPILLSRRQVYRQESHRGSTVQSPNVNPVHTLLKLSPH